jgi:hypothetical protein
MEARIAKMKQELRLHESNNLQLALERKQLKMDHDQAMEQMNKKSDQLVRDLSEVHVRPVTNKYL